MNGSTSERGSAKRPHRSHKRPACGSASGTLAATMRASLLCLAFALLHAPWHLSAEPAAPKDDLEELFAEDEIKDVKFRFRTRFSRNMKELDEQRVLYCYKIEPDEAPKIDGKIAVSEVWAKNRIDTDGLAPEEVRVDRTKEAWIQCVEGTVNRRQTVAYTCYDTENIYVCFVCEEPDQRKTRMEVRPAHDIWWDDCVETFFEIGDVNGSGQRFHFLANVADRTQLANNSHWKMTDYEWKGTWGAKRWIVELAIPFRSFKVGEYQYRGPPLRGELWGLKFCREGSPIVGGGERRMYSVWEHIPVLNFTLPEYSGMLVFQDRNALVNENLSGDEDADGIPDEWELIKSAPDVKAEFGLRDGQARFKFEVREKVEAALVRQKFGTRVDTFYEVRASLNVDQLEGEAFLEIYESGQEPIRRVKITDQAVQSHKFEFRSDRDKELYFAIAARGGKGELSVTEVRVEQQLFTVPEGVICLTNNSARKDLRYSEIIKKRNEVLQKKGEPPTEYAEGGYRYRLRDNAEEFFPRERPRRLIAYDSQGEGVPEKEVQAGWVPFSKGSLTEGRGKDDKNSIYYASNKRAGSEVPEGVDVVFDLKKNYFIQMIEVFPMTGGMNGLDIYVQPDGALKDYLVWKMNGAGVLNPVKEMMIAKVRGIDSVGRIIRLGIRHKAAFNLKEIRIWGQPQGTHKDAEIRHFRWKDGIVVPPKSYTQMEPPAKPFIYPLPRELKYEQGEFVLRDGLTIIHMENDQDRRTAEILSQDLAARGLTSRLVADGEVDRPPAGAVWLGTAPASKSTTDRLASLGVEVSADDPGPEGYALVVRPELAILAGSDPAGAVYARDSFMQLLTGSTDTGLRVPAITVRDWPNVPLRTLNMIYVGGLTTAKATDEEIERFIRVLCRYRFNGLYLSGIPSPGRRRLAADYNVTVVSGAGLGGRGPAAEVATDETYAHVTSEKFDFGSRVNPNPSHPGNYYRLQNQIWPLTQDPLSRFAHVGHDEMTWVTSGSRWNESRLSLLRNRSGGDLFAETILREHDMLKRVRRDTVTLNTVLTTHGEKDRDEYAQMNRAYPLLARDITIDNYHSGSGKLSDPYYCNTSGFERTIYIWGRPKPGQHWGHEVTGFWMAHWSAFSLGAILREWYGNSAYWASRAVLESQFSWNPYDDLVKTQPEREDLQIGDHDQTIALASLRTSELLAGHQYPSWRLGATRDYRTIDLRKWANWSHVDDRLLDGRGWVDKGTNYDLRRLPTGEVKFADVPFTVLSPAGNGGRSVVMLQNLAPSAGGWPGAHRRARIPVGMSVGSFTFLRATMQGGGPAPIYEAVYEGGGHLRIPVVYTGWNGGGRLRSATRRDVWPAWLGDAPCGDPLVLYAYEWVNPYPEKEVREVSIDFVTPEGQRYTEVLFALTVLRASPTDSAEWSRRPSRPPILTLARSGVDRLPSAGERVLYGQSFAFTKGKPTVKRSLGSEKVGAVSARAFNPAKGLHTKPTSDGYVIPVYGVWSDAFREKTPGPFPNRDGGTFEVRLSKPIQASAFTLKADGTYNLALQVSADGKQWKSMGQGWGAGPLGAQGFVFPARASIIAFRITLKVRYSDIHDRLHSFAFHE